MWYDERTRYKVLYLLLDIAMKNPSRHFFSFFLHSTKTDADGNLNIIYNRKRKKRPEGFLMALL